MLFNISGQHQYHRESETLTDCVYKQYNKIAIDKETQEALARIPDRINNYMTDESSKEKLSMGFALRKSTPRKRFTAQQRRYLDAKFEEGKRSKSKFDARLLAQDMRDSLSPTECLTWQQISSYFSVRGRKQRNEPIANENDDIIIGPDGEITQIPDNQYETDPNVGTIDDDVHSKTEQIMNSFD